MTDDKVVVILQRDLENKLLSVNISILSYTDVEHCLIMYTLIDNISRSERRFDVLKEDFVGLDKIHKAMKLYDIIIKEAQLLVNERCS